MPQRYPTSLRTCTSEVCLASPIPKVGWVGRTTSNAICKRSSIPRHSQPTESLTGVPAAAGNGAAMMLSSTSLTLHKKKRYPPLYYPSQQASQPARMLYQNLPRIKELVGGPRSFIALGCDHLSCRSRIRPVIVHGTCGLPLALRLASTAILLLVKCPRWAKSLVESRLPSSRSIRTICKRMIARTSDFYMMLKVSGKELGSYFVMPHFIEMTRAIDYAL